MTDFNFQPVIIIGAARSGTNMLRDMLCKLPEIGTWPCDEINYIWRYGNAKFPHDEIPVSLATPRVKNYIRRAFATAATKNKANWLVEKTCANSLRVDFVDSIIPEAKYIFLVRDGRDVVASAMKRWKAELDIPYLLKKVRYVPVGDLPYYGMRYLGNRIARLISRDKKLAFWGPAYEGMDDILKLYSLQEVCALQWVHSVLRSADTLEELPPERVHCVGYESFVSQPDKEFKEIVSFLGADVSTETVAALVGNISRKSVGKWQTDLDVETLNNILPHLSTTLEQFGYAIEEQSVRKEAA